MLDFSAKQSKALRTTGMGKDTFEKFIPSDFDLETYLIVLQAQGLLLIEQNNRIYFNTSQQSLKDQIFCIVDIECNGSKYDKDQIIEIGAVKYKNGVILDTFSSLIHTTTLSKTIQELTGISLKDLEHAPSLKEVMQRFRLFLADDIFVAHALKFDYEFVSAMFERVDLEPMLNRSFCTINLSERTFSSAKYGLTYLNKTLLKDENFKAHRALNDALLTTKLFEYIIPLLPKKIENGEDLILFSKEAKRKPRAKLIEIE